MLRVRAGLATKPVTSTLYEVLSLPNRKETGNKGEVLGGWKRKTHTALMKIKIYVKPVSSPTPLMTMMSASPLLLQQALGKSQTGIGFSNTWIRIKVLLGFLPLKSELDPYDPSILWNGIPCWSG